MQTPVLTCSLFRPGHCARMAATSLAFPLQIVRGLELLLCYAGIKSKAELSLGTVSKENPQGSSCCQPLGQHKCI